MPILKPEEIDAEFETAFNRRDMEAVLALYEPDAAMVPEPGKTVRGHAAVREVVGRFLSLQGKIDVQTRRVYRTDDVAVSIAPWTLEGTGPDGKPVKLGGESIAIARKQPDGTWKMVIDDPFGTM